MQLEDSRPDGSSRWRLVDIRVDGERGHLQLGAHLSGVLTGASTRSEAARLIAATVVGPRPPDAGGSIEIDGTVVSVSTLPSPLLPASSPSVIDLAVVHAQWQASWGERRDDVAAAHASCRLEGYRIDAALALARDRLPAPGARIGSAAPLEVEPPPAPVDWAHPPDGTTHLRAKLRTLLTTLDATQPEPLPEGLLLADAWDAHAALLRARNAADELPADDLESLERRVNAARSAAAMSSGGVPDEHRTRIEQCHRVVVAAEGELFEAKRRQRAGAIARYEEAVAAELVAISDAGLDSYASFLFEITGRGAAADLGARLAAEAELAAARMALDLARQVPAVPTRVELDEREVQMRVRAAELLHRAPGTDPATELRALHVESEGREETLADIGEVLSSAGIAVGPDVVGSARALLAAPTALPPSDPDPEVAPVPPVVASPSVPTLVPIGTVDPARWREVADLEEQRAAQNRVLAELEAELSRVDRINEAEVSRLGGTDLTRGLEWLLVAYRARDLLDGRLPLILDGVLDGLAADEREAAVQVFARATDVQTVVVTNDPEVMQSLSREGGTLVRWPESMVAIYDEPALEPAPTRRT